MPAYQQNNADLNDLLTDKPIGAYMLQTARSEEAQELIGRAPSWLILWGNTLYLGLLLLLVFVGWFVQYPDLVKANLRVVATNAPKPVLARSDGLLEKLFVKDGQNVQKGQRLAFLESTGNHNEVLALGQVVDSLVVLSGQSNIGAMYEMDVPSFFQLGEVQKSYQTFQDAFVRSRALVSGGAFAQKRAALNNDLQQLQALENNLDNQAINYQSDLELADADITMQRKLYRDKVIPDVEMRQAQSKYLGKKQTYDQAKTSLNNNQMSQNQKRQEILELNKTTAEQTNGLLQAINTLKSDIEAWKQRYVAIAPAVGKVSFLTQLQENKPIKTGQELFYILAGGGGFYGEMQVGQYNFGKVKAGQEVLVKFPSYPFQEFGIVAGRIETVAEMSKDTAYIVRVSFPKGLVTSSQKTIPFRNGLMASGEIVTENLNLIERLFYELRRVIKR
jgi:multidrug resistance efflux pump